jgi:hypothetical protein
MLTTIRTKRLSIDTRAFINAALLDPKVGTANENVFDDDDDEVEFPALGSGPNADVEGPPEISVIVSVFGGSGGVGRGSFGLFVVVLVAV